MHFTVRHPDDSTWIAKYGHDPARGAWAELVYCGVKVSHEHIEVDFDANESVRSILCFLTSYGFLAGDAVADAFEWLATPTCWRGCRPPRAVRRVLGIVDALGRAAGS